MMGAPITSILIPVVVLYSMVVSLAYVCVDSPVGLNGTDSGEDALVYNGTVTASRAGKHAERRGVTGSDTRKHVQVDLHVVHRVSGLTFQDNLSDQLWFAYSRDGRVWTNYTDEIEQRNIDLHASQNSTPMVQLSMPIQARYLRVESGADNASGFTSIRLQVYGCLVSQDNQTLITGDIQSGQHEWFPSTSPYVVTKKMTIGVSSRLTVHAGVKVLFAENAGLLVEGQFHIKGSETDPVVFSGLYGSKWAGISVHNGSVCIDHAVMEGGVELSTPEEHSDKVTLLLNNSELVFHRVNMVAHVFDVNITNSLLNIQSSTFTVNNGTDVNSLVENGTICIQNSSLVSIGSNAAVNVSIGRNVSVHSFKLLKSQIIADDGVHVMSKTNTFDVVLEGTSFATQGVCFSASGQFNKVNVSTNNFNVSGTAVDLHIGEKVEAGLDNGILGSHRFGYVALNWKQEKLYKTKVVRTKVHLTRNNITGSKVTVTCPYKMIHPVNISNNVFERSVLSLGTPHVVIRRNIFRRHTPSIEYDGETYKHHDIDATYNYWGCGTTALIGKKIWDFTNDTSLPKITVVPYFKDRTLKTLVNKTSFVISGGRIGGPVDGKVFLSRDKSPYIAVSDIYIGGPDSLTVNAGVTILFKEKVRVVVDGSLFLNGRYDMPVQLLSETTGKPWGGLILGTNNRPAIRLTGGTDEREGTVLVWSRSQYRPICAESKKRFNITHGHVVCRMAGFDPSGGVTVQAPRTFSGAGIRQSYSYANIKCNGNESDLVYCDGEESGCGISFGYANKPSLRCDGEKLYNSDNDFPTDVVIRNVMVNDTTQGITIIGNVSVMENVTSQFSRSNGLTFDPVFTAKHLLVIRNVDASYNDKDGIAIHTDKAYRMFRLQGCSLNQNKGSGLRLAGYPTVRVDTCNISGNGDGIYSNYHSIVNLTVHSSTLLHNRDHAVYFESGEIIPIHLWSVVYRAQIHMQISNSTFSQRYKNYTTWPGGQWYGNDYCLICIYSWNGSLLFHDNAFINSTSKHILKLRPYATNVEIHKNTITNSSAEHILLVQSYVDQSYRKLPNSTATVRDNVFKNNRGTSVIVLDLEDNYTADVSGNHLIDNSANTSLWVQMKGVTVENNTFLNPQSFCEINGLGDHNMASVERRNDFNQGDAEMVQDDVCITWHYSKVCGRCLRRRRPNDVITTSDIVSDNNINGTTPTTLAST